MPKEFNNYYEPFVGGGSVFLSLNIKPEYKMYLNDKSHDLMGLYEVVKNQDEDFFKNLDKMGEDWSLLKNIALKFYQQHEDACKNFIDNKNETGLIKVIKDFLNENKHILNNLFGMNYEKETLFNEIIIKIPLRLLRLKETIYDEIETSFKYAYFLHIRFLFNNQEKYNIKEKYAIFYFVLKYVFSGIIKFNKKGYLNTGYGGCSYNKRTLDKYIKNLKSKEMIEHLNNAMLYNLDFEDFLIKTEPNKDDFIFLDPPYDCTYTSYHNNTFNKEDHKRLADFLINKTKAKFLMIIKKTDFIYDLYNKDGVYIDDYDFRYALNANNTDNRVKQLVIRNYKD